MAGVKNFNLTGIANDVQFGKRGGRVLFDDAENVFSFVESDGVTNASVATQDLTVNGNFTVLGESTTINVETLTVQDNLIEINSGEEGTGVTAGTAGIDINRGTELNAQMIWDETTDTIKFQYSDGTLLDIDANLPVQNSESLYRDSDGKIILDGSGTVSETAEYLDLETSTNAVTLTSRNEAGSGDVDLVLTTQGNGSVIIASSGDNNSYLGSVDGVDLTLSGGDEGDTTQTGNIKLSGGDGTTVTGGDVILSGGANGGSVRVDTTVTDVSDSSTDDTVSTVGYVKSKVTNFETTFITGSDTPEAYGTLGQFVVVNDTADGLKFTDFPEISINDLSDTPELSGTAGQVLAVNDLADGLEYVTLDTSFIGADDTPVSFGTEGQVLAVNATTDAVEFIDLPTQEKAFTGLTDTPVALGTEGQILTVNTAGDALEFTDQVAGVTTLVGLEDVPAAFGTEGQVLAVNATTDGVEFVDVISSFIDSTDTPDVYGTAGQYLVVNGTTDGVEFADLPSLDKAFTELTDTPEALGTDGQVLVVNALGTGLEFSDQSAGVTTLLGLDDAPEAFGTTGQVLAVNDLADGVEFVDVISSFIDSTDTPEVYGTAGQYLVINGTADGVEFTDLPEQDKAFTELTDTPAAFGTEGQVLAVNTATDALEFVDQAAGVTTLLGLEDAPEAFGTTGQVLAVNDVGDAVEFVDVSSKTLDVIEVADLYSSIATVDATTGAYAVVATPKAVANTTATTDKLIITRMTIKVPNNIDAGVGFKVVVQDDSTSAEDVVIDAGDSSDVAEGVYVIDGIFQDVSFDVLQNVAIALVDDLGDAVASTAGTISVLTEYKTVFV